MAVPVSREVFENPGGGARSRTPVVPETGYEQRPFTSQTERIADDALALRLMPVEMIQSITPQFPLWLFPPDLPHTPPITPAECYPPVEVLQRSLLDDPARGRGQPMPRPSLGVAANTSGSPRNVSGPV